MSSVLSRPRLRDTTQYIRTFAAAAVAVAAAATGAAAAAAFEAAVLEAVAAQVCLDVSFGVCVVSVVERSFRSGLVCTCGVV